MQYAYFIYCINSMCIIVMIKLVASPCSNIVGRIYKVTQC